MRRDIFSIVVSAIFCLVFSDFMLSGCSNPNNNNDQEIEKKKTSIRIKNESYSLLMNVHLQDKYFEPTVQNPYGIEGLPGDPGYFSAGDISSTIALTEDTSGYIYFVLYIYTEGGGVRAYPCHTRELVVVNRGEENEFIFTDNTLVVDYANPSNVQTLKNMEAYIKGLE
ncbi:MAG: hypothetical protein LBD93_08825 [Treponema sp.]|nr:hypothetical protein [Treponema sp.]